MSLPTERWSAAITLPKYHTNEASGNVLVPILNVSMDDMLRDFPLNASLNVSLVALPLNASLTVASRFSIDSMIRL